jgi:peptidoglycan/xylan/chitin deacetylase (PgdA/CDA1 family)
MPVSAHARPRIGDCNIEGIKRKLVFRLLRLTLLPLLIRETIQRRRVTIIFYHDPSPETLGSHLALLGRTYNLIPLRQFVDARRLRRIGTLPSKSLVVSLDDGHAGNFGLKPLFENTGVPVTIFLCSGIVGTGRRFWFKHTAKEVESLKRLPDGERLNRLRELGFDELREFSNLDALSRDQIHALAPVVDFQSHSVSHPVLPNCSDEKSELEVTGSKQELERDYGLEIYALSYPNGDYSEREIVLAKRAGYQCALTADAGFNSNDTDPFRLRRICIDDTDGVDELLVKTCGLWGWVNGILRRKALGYTPVAHAPPKDAATRPVGSRRNPGTQTCDLCGMNMGRTNPD